MVYRVYTIKDKVAEESGPPFIAVNDGVAKRNYKDMGIPESLKDDYELYFIGYWDSIESSITPAICIVKVEDTDVKTDI